MVVTGRVHGAAARKYAGYCYRKPIKTRLDIFSIDPARIDPLHEYPRIIEKPMYPAECKTVDLADYEAFIGAMNEKGESQLTITMLPNEYTQAEVPLVVYEMTINGILPNSGFCIDEAMRRCFSGI
jgi:hypothetical protein